MINATISPARPLDNGSLFVRLRFLHGTIPGEIKWSLFDAGGNVINARSAVDVPAGELGATVAILLTGADLALADANNERELRIFQAKIKVGTVYFYREVPFWVLRRVETKGQA